MRNFIIFIFLLLPVLVKSGEKPKVNFFDGNILNIKEKARTEGKLYVYDFVAPWCTPCKIMDETTFNDEVLADYISENYVFAKINIEDFDGMALKEQYQIHCLPTILVFNQDGEIIAKHESSISSSKLLHILKNCNTEANGAGKVNPPQIDLVENTPVAVAVDSVFKAPKIVTKPSISSEKIIKPIISSEKPSKITPNINTLKVKREKSTLLNLSSNLYHIDILNATAKGFGIQTCALTQYDNVIKHYENMKKTYPNQPVFMHVTTSDNKTMYKILVGEFKTKSAAENFKKSNALEGYVKDLNNKG